MSKREIKFRMWHNGGMMPAGIGISKLPSDGLVLTIDDLVHQWDIKGIPVMQYTGLKDKNDVEIYEGDVVMPLYGNEPHAVIWDQGTCSFDLVRNGHSEHLFDTTGAGDMGHNHWEVIGNIYEHGHLLEE